MAINYAAAIYALDDSDMDVYQSRIWLRILRRGVCFETQRNIAEGTNISLAQVNRTVKWLRSNGWIEPTVDKKSGKVGYAAVIPQEQVQQNSVIPQEQIIPEVEHVIPQERHLKINYKDNTTTVHAILCKKFLMLTGIDPPHETTDNYTDDWQAPFDIWLQRFGDVEVVMEKMAAAVQNAIENGWRYKSPRSLMKTIANEHANGSSTNGNGRIDKHALKEALWHIVTRSKDYTEAKMQAGPDEWGFLKAMGKWRDVRSLNETTFNIRFYEVFKNANH